MGHNNENCETSNCSTTSCNTKESHWCNSGCDMTDGLMKMADKAWEQLMLEKMKKVFEKHNGAKMDKVAEAAVGASLKHWENKMKAQADVHMSLDNLRKSMM